MRTKSEFLQHLPFLKWNLTPGVIEKRSMDLIADINERNKNLTSLSIDKINFESVCESLADIDVEIQREQSIIEVYFRTSPIAKMRDKCLELSKTWSDFIFELKMRRDIYDLLTKVKSIEKSLPYESSRYLEKLLHYKRRYGLHLGADIGEKLKDLLKKLAILCTIFNKNLSDENTKIEFEKQDLLGMNNNFFKGLSKKDGKFIVTLKYKHLVPILKHCKVIKTRQIMEKAQNSRCIDQNIKILEDILELRKQIVEILGYNTHADFVTEILMSKSAVKVHEFLTSLFEKIQNASKKEMDRLLELKKNECEEMGVEFDGKIHMYDCSYYKNMVEEQDKQIDKNLIKEYFPFVHVTTQLLNIFETLLGLKFEEVSDPPVVHPDVFLYAVVDKATNSLIAYLYMDLFPRQFKYSQAAYYGIQNACNYKSKTQIGCAYMIANFTKPYLGKPSLLTHEEIITYFHEFGHVMHHVCSKTRYSLLQ